MPAVYLADVVRDESLPFRPWVPVVPAGVTWAALMIDGERGKAIIVSPDGSLTAPGLRKLVEGATVEELRTAAASTSTSTAERGRMDTWLAAAGLSPVPAGPVSLRDVIHHAVRQVNPLAGLDRLGGLELETPSPPVRLGPPPLSAVGPRGALTNRAGGLIPPATYQGINFTSALRLQPSGVYNFIDVRTPTINDWDGTRATPLYYRPGRTVTLDHVDSGALWFENVGELGGQTGWTITWSRLYGGDDRALRPQGKGKIFVSDSWLIADQIPPAGAHRQAMQMRLGAEGRFERVAFSQTPVPNNTVSNVVSIEATGDGADTQFVDCEVGYWNGSAWQRGGGVYAVYPGQSQWFRPVIHAPATAAWYNGVPPRTLVEPVYV